MSDPQLSTLQHEWITLQTQFDSYEKYSLTIKLISIITCSLLIFALHAHQGAIAVVAILWLQDGIWKTFQNRIGLRLESVEKLIQTCMDEKSTDKSIIGMQFNLAWSESRPGALGLINEYLKSTMKPTVAYPHAILIVCVGIYMWVS